MVWVWAKTTYYAYGGGVKFDQGPRLYISQDASILQTTKTWAVAGNEANRLGCGLIRGGADFLIKALASNEYRDVS